MEKWSSARCYFLVSSMLTRGSPPWWLGCMQLQETKHQNPKTYMHSLCRRSPWSMATIQKKNFSMVSPDLWRRWESEYILKATASFFWTYCSDIELCSAILSRGLRTLSACWSQPAATFHFPSVLLKAKVRMITKLTTHWQVLKNSTLSQIHYLCFTEMKSEFQSSSISSFVRSCS